MVNQRSCQMARLTTRHLAYLGMVIFIFISYSARPVISASYASGP